MSQTALSIAIVTFAFLAYLSFQGNKGIFEMLTLKYGNEGGQWRHIVAVRLFGALIFGATSIITAYSIGYSAEYIGIAIAPTLLSLIFIACFGLIMVVVNYFAARTEDNLAMYPQIRIEKFSTSVFIISAITWLLYLMGYEIMLRGFLFSFCMAEFDLKSAILINISIYALIHLPKGLKETIGSLPMGAVLCYITYKTGSIWAAFFIHGTLALSNEWFSIKYHKLLWKK
jgi:membrane protease YdiL (CAAX protease family)